MCIPLGDERPQLEMGGSVGAVRPVDLSIAKGEEIVQIKELVNNGP